eukprot:1141134-Pelagomonas_calceolata.AAC.5
MPDKLEEGALPLEEVTRLQIVPCQTVCLAFSKPASHDNTPTAGMPAFLVTSPKAGLLGCIAYLTGLLVYIAYLAGLLGCIPTW